jgi:hypothetical protein
LVPRPADGCTAGWAEAGTCGREISAKLASTAASDLLHCNNLSALIDSYELFLPTTTAFAAEGMTGGFGLLALISRS